MLEGSTAIVNVLDAVRSGKMGYEKAATMFETMHMLGDPEDPKLETYKKLAAQFSLADQASKAAGKQVPVDLGAMGVDVQKIEPTLGGGGPKAGTKENPIKLD